MDRRGFFKSVIKESTKTLARAVELAIKAKFKRTVIRPPGALPEERFLLSCTRCGDCKTACPYEAISMVDIFSGGVSANTPFIDPYLSACMYCKDMPCITACEAKALRRDNDTTIKLGVARINLEHCLIAQGQYCDYCFKSCPEGIAAICKNEDGKPDIYSELCVGCGKCAYICVSQTGKAITIEPI